MIPYKIHYCWFGGSPLSNMTKKCINSWKRFLPKYEIIEWNETNFDINSSPKYVREAYQAKKYAFVSDYVRLYVLYRFGGIYMDTDVEVKHSLDSFMHLDSFLCFESEILISTALIATHAKSEWILQLIKQYECRSFILKNGKIDYTTNVDIITNYLKKQGLLLNGEHQIINNKINIFPQCFFSNSKGCGEKEIYAIHHFSASWHSPMVRFLELILPTETVKKIASYKEKFHKIIKRS